MSDTLKLNLGAGAFPLEGYINLDRKNGQEAYPLAYPDGSADEVRASHILEHWSHREVLKVIQDWVRVLKPGGWLKIAVPDFGLIAKNYAAGVEGLPMQGWVMGGHTDANDHHGALFDADLLYDLLEGVGLINIQEWQSEAKDCASYSISLNLCGRKPLVTAPQKIGCAMSVPRLGFMSNFFCWADALLPLGIKPVAVEGAFWGQCLERVMEMMVDSDWVLTIDYDSFFTARDVQQLIVTAANHPEVDAIAPVQMKRGTETLPMMTMRDANGQAMRTIDTAIFNEPLTRVHTAHFGLTLLRASKLRAMQHPWFRGEPDADGRWGKERKDDDVYFWHKWAEAGNSLYLANRVVIGHGEYVVLLPDEQFKPLYMNTSEWRQQGPPRNVRR